MNWGRKNKGEIEHIIYCFSYVQSPNNKALILY